MLVFGLGLISPGPDFAIVSTRASQFGRRPGVYTALGVSSGVWVLVFASCYGLQTLLSTYPQAGFYLQIFGAFFLAYLGIKALVGKSKKRGRNSSPLKKDIHGSSRRNSLITGFITNVTNVKALLFISSVLSQKSEYLQTFDHVLLITALITLGTFIWFSFIAYLFSMRSGSLISQIQKHVPTVMGVFLLYLAGTFLMSAWAML